MTSPHGLTSCSVKRCNAQTDQQNLFPACRECGGGACPDHVSKGSATEHEVPGETVLTVLHGPCEWKSLSDETPDLWSLQKTAESMSEKEQHEWFEHHLGLDIAFKLSKKTGEEREVTDEDRRRALLQMLNNSAKDDMSPADMKLCKKWLKHANRLIADRRLFERRLTAQPQLAA